MAERSAGGAGNTHTEDLEGLEGKTELGEIERLTDCHLYLLEAVER